MPYCPNPDCPPRKRSGQPAEYQAGMTHCADCGTELQTEDPTAAKNPPRPKCPKVLKRRLWLGLIICSGLYLLGWLPHPLIDHGALPHSFSFFGTSELGLRDISPLSQGITPFLIGFILVELFALVVPALRRKRLSDLRFRAKLRTAGLIVGAGWAFAQGLSISFWLENLAWSLNPSWSSSSLVPDPGWMFRLATALLMTAGSAIYVLAAHLVDRHALGRGFAVVLLAQVVFALPSALASAYGHLMSGILQPMGVLLLIGILAGVFLGLRWFYAFSDRLVQRTPVRLPTCGSFPLELAWLLCLLPGLLATFLWAPWIQDLSALFSPGSDLCLLIQLGAVFALTVPISVMFHWRRRTMLKSKPYRAFWRSAQIFSGLFLMAAVGLDYFLAPGLDPIGPLWPGAMTLIFVYVLTADLLHEIDLRWRAPGAVDLVAIEVHQDVADALAAEKAFAHWQPEKGVSACGLRYRSLTYVFGPFVPLVLLGPDDTERNPAFSGGDALDEEELIKQFE